MAIEKMEASVDAVSEGGGRSPWQTPVLKRFAAGRAQQGNGAFNPPDGNTAKS